MSYFDRSRQIVHNTTAALFGEMAAWTPTTGGAEQRFQVNYNHPEKDDALGSLDATQWEFTALDQWIEYQSGQFTGLKEACDQGRRETVTLTDQTGAAIGSFRVTKVRAMADGNTYKAKIQLLP